MSARRLISVVCNIPPHKLALPHESIHDQVNQRRQRTKNKKVNKMIGTTLKIAHKASSFRMAFHCVGCRREPAGKPGSRL